MTPQGHMLHPSMVFPHPSSNRDVLTSTQSYQSSQQSNINPILPLSRDVFQQALHVNRQTEEQLQMLHRAANQEQNVFHSQFSQSLSRQPHHTKSFHPNEHQYPNTFPAFHGTLNNGDAYASHSPQEHLGIGLGITSPLFSAPIPNRKYVAVPSRLMQAINGESLTTATLSRQPEPAHVSTLASMGSISRRAPDDNTASSSQQLPSQTTPFSAHNATILAFSAVSSQPPNSFLDHSLISSQAEKRRRWQEDEHGDAAMLKQIQQQRDAVAQHIKACLDSISLWTKQAQEYCKGIQKVLKLPFGVLERPSDSSASQPPVDLPSEFSSIVTAAKAIASFDAPTSSSSSSSGPPASLSPESSGEVYLLTKTGSLVKDFVAGTERSLDTLITALPSYHCSTSDSAPVTRAAKPLRDLVSSLSETVASLPGSTQAVRLASAARISRAALRSAAAAGENTKKHLEVSHTLLLSSLRETEEFGERHGLSSDSVDPSPEIGIALPSDVEDDVEGVRRWKSYIAAKHAAKDVLTALENLAQAASAEEAAALAQRKAQMQAQETARLEAEKKRRLLTEDSPISRLRRDAMKMYRALMAQAAAVREATNPTAINVRKQIVLECTKSLNRISATTTSVAQCLKNVRGVWGMCAQGAPAAGLNSEQLMAFVVLTCAELLVNAHDTVPGILYGKAMFANELARMNPTFKLAFVGTMAQVCPLATAKQPVNRTGVAFKRELGFAIVDGQLETTPRYLENLTAYLSLYFAWYHVRCVQNNAPSSANDVKEAKGELWGWVATILNAPLGPHSSTALLCMLRFSGYAFCMSFPKQSTKIYNVFLELFREMDNSPASMIGGPEGKTAMMNISSELEQWRSQGRIAVNPASKLAHAQHSDSAQMQITSEDLNSFS